MAGSIVDISRVQDPGLQAKISKALKIVLRALALYPSGKLAFSFNGGKDSSVLLHLLRAAVKKLGEQDFAAGSPSSSSLAAAAAAVDKGPPPPAFHSFFFARSDDFEELEEFVGQTDRRYQLQLEYLTNPDFKRGLQEYMDRTGALAMVLGTRRGDPNAGDQEFFSPSSEGWPAFMRVNPILDWTYHDVWAFLRTFNFEYCSLYDRGFTSLGSIHNTVPNAALKASAGGFAPAYMLADASLERSGRVAPEQPSPCPSPHDHVGWSPPH